jgi:hypothetical protein
MSPGFVFEELGTPSRFVRFESIERPHGDALTFLLVTIEAHGLSATASIETLDGDGGVDLDSERPTASGSTSDLSHLSGFLESLATGPVWEGKRRWGSLGNELVVSAGVDLLGHVALEFTVVPQPWRPSWSATCGVSSTLGDLQSVAHELREWVADQV